MKVIKYCTNPGITGSGSWHQYPGTGHDELSVRNKQGTLQTFSGNVYPVMILADGTLIHLYASNVDGSSTPGFLIYGYIAIDVNGFKKPNVIGKDIFEVFILENKLSPFGSLKYADTCDTTGQGCAAEYLYK